MENQNKQIYLLSLALIDIHGKAAVQADIPASVGAIVAFREDAFTHYGKVSAVVATQEDSELHSWVRSLSCIDDRQISGVWECAQPVAAEK